MTPPVSRPSSRTARCISGAPREKLENLRAAMVGQSPLTGHISESATRWATHGKPSEENAHPHKAGPVAVIHNGIIENFVALRTALVARGHKDKVDTDTERSHLIEEENVGRGMQLTEAVRAAVGELRGSFSIVVMSESEPDKLVAAKTATPMVLGYGAGENFIASDIPALLEHTRMTLVLEDGELAEVTASGIKVMRFDGRPVTRAPRRVEWSSAVATKGGYKHYLRKEIAEQPQAWIDTMAGRAAANSASVSFETDLMPAAGGESIKRIVMLGAGASWITANIGKFIIEEIAGVPVEVDYAGEFRYRRPPVGEGTVVIAVSQSGETADTLAAMEEGAARGAHLIALTNTLDSSIARKANAQIYTRCGPEISVTTTKCFLTQIEAYYLYAIHLGIESWAGYQESRVSELLKTAFAIPSQIGGVSHQRRTNRSEGSPKVCIGDGFSLPRKRYQLSGGLPGALKLKGDLIHPCRGIFGQRNEAWPDRTHRRQDAGVVLHRMTRYSRNLVQYEGSGSLPWDHRGHQSQIAGAGAYRRRCHRGPGDLGAANTGADDSAAATARVSYRGRGAAPDVDQPRNRAKSVTVE